MSAASGAGRVTLSVVSHGQADLVGALLADIATMPEIARVVITLNLPGESLTLPPTLAAPVTWRHNSVPRGFGANHNAAFTDCDTDCFCVINPDVRCPRDPFAGLVAAAFAHDAALCAPAILDPDGRVEDSVRHFPRPLALAAKALGLADGRYDFALDAAPFAADWVAGMFMMFRSADFRRVGGFDEGFFLYYEDVDICARLWRAGRKVLACPEFQAVHDARRESHRNTRYLRWHAASMARYFRKHYLRLPVAAHGAQ